jgi:hypothetical protein
MRPSRKTWIFPMQTWNGLFDNGGSTMIPPFHNGKIRIKHWNIGPMISVDSFPYVLLIQL